MQMTEVMMQILMAFIGTLGFSILFAAPPRLWGWCGFTGMVSWGIYLYIGRVLHMPVVGTFAAAVILTVICRYLAVFLRASTTVFLICGIFTLVPGASVYYMAYNLVTGMEVEAMQRGIDCIKLAMAIGIGIGAGYCLPAKMFGWHRTSELWIEK